MYGGEFDGNAAFAGGGFMPSQATTQAPDSSYFKNRDVRTLLPLTLKQLSSVSTNGESNFSVDGVDINTVTIVGRISRMENRISQIDFVVDDGTGWVDCVRWCQGRQETEEMEAVRLGMYVRLHGHLKSFQGKRSVNVFSVRPVTDFNEIVHHFIECMYVHKYNTKTQGGPIAQAPATAIPQMPYSTMPTPAKPFQTASSNQFPNQFNDQTHSTMQTVLNYLNQPRNLGPEVGVHYDVISRDLRIPLPQVKDAIEMLANDGCVYSTNDDSCFRSTTDA